MSTNSAHCCFVYILLSPQNVFQDFSVKLHQVSCILLLLRTNYLPTTSFLFQIYWASNCQSFSIFLYAKAIQILIRTLKRNMMDWEQSSTHPNRFLACYWEMIHWALNLALIRQPPVHSPQLPKIQGLLLKFVLDIVKFQREVNLPSDLSSIVWYPKKGFKIMCHVLLKKPPWLLQTEQTITKAR